MPEYRTTKCLNRGLPCAWGSFLSCCSDAGNLCALLHLQVHVSEDSYSLHGMTDLLQNGDYTHQVSSLYYDILYQYDLR